MTTTMVIVMMLRMMFFFFGPPCASKVSVPLAMLTGVLGSSEGPDRQAQAAQAPHGGQLPPRPANQVQAE